MSVSGKALCAMFEALPNGSPVELIVETSEVHYALQTCTDVITQVWEAKLYCLVPEWVNMMGIWKQKGTQMRVREFEE
jgi:hypothetical protein